MINASKLEMNGNASSMINASKLEMNGNASYDKCFYANGNAS